MHPRLWVPRMEATAVAILFPHSEVIHLLGAARILPEISISVSCLVDVLYSHIHPTRAANYYKVESTYPYKSNPGA
jgi:hypothetical protein